MLLWITLEPTWFSMFRLFCLLSLLNSCHSMRTSNDENERRKGEEKRSINLTMKMDGKRFVWKRSGPKRLPAVRNVSRWKMSINISWAMDWDVVWSDIRRVCIVCVCVSDCDGEMSHNRLDEMYLSRRISYAPHIPFKSSNWRRIYSALDKIPFFTWQRRLHGTHS